MICWTTRKNIKKMRAKKVYNTIRALVFFSILCRTQGDTAKEQREEKRGGKAKTRQGEAGLIQKRKKQQMKARESDSALNRALNT